MTSVSVSPVEAAGLRAYLERVLALDDRAAVRVQAASAVAGVWSGPPFGVLALRPVGLLEPAEADVTASARRLLEAVEARSSDEVQLPASVLGPPWAALLPPQRGWALEAQAPAAALVDQVSVAVEGFRRRADLLAESDRSPAELETIAGELWAASSLGSAPLRAAHAAARLGLLGRDGQVSSYVAGAWVRLGCPGGSVLTRTDADGSLGGADRGVMALGSGSALGSLDVLGLFGRE